MCKFKAKNTEPNAAPLCLGNVSKDFPTDNMENTELYGYVCDFDSIGVAYHLDIYKCFMKIHDI